MRVANPGTERDRRPSLIILSFTPLFRDARVLKQVRLLKDDYRVTTCGYGSLRVAGVKHIEIPSHLTNELNGRHITLGLKVCAYWQIPAVKWVLNRLKSDDFDIGLANDLEAVPVLLKVAPSHGLHVDLHEYAPSLGEESPVWVRRIQPYVNKLASRYLTEAKREGATFTTVSSGLADEYKRVFGIDAGIVANAAPFEERPVMPVHSPIRLVHVGVCLRNRSLHTMIEAVENSQTDLVFDLYLLPNDPPYLEELKSLVSDSRRVRIMPPLPQDQVVSTMADYDLGVHILPAVSFNNLWALPNKLFDFIQARIGVITGPNPEMAAVVRENKIGVVTADYGTESLRKVLNSIAPDDVLAWKTASGAAARSLSSEDQVVVWANKIASHFPSASGTGFDVDVIVPIHDSARNFERMVSSILDARFAKTRVIAVLHNLSVTERRRIVERLNTVGNASYWGETTSATNIVVLALNDGIASPAGPFNLGLRRASATWIAKADSDDELAEGAIDHWVRRGSTLDADAVVPQITGPDGLLATTPPIRSWRRVRLDSVKDRLYYRSSPMGLVRLETARALGLQMTEGARNGEDIAYLAPLWSNGKIVSALGEPGYLERDDAPTRATTTQMATVDQLSGIYGALEPQVVSQLTCAQRRALGTKLLRRDLKELVAKQTWSDGLRKEDSLIFRDVVTKILTICEGAANDVSKADWILLKEVCRNTDDNPRIAPLLADAQKIRSWNSIRPHRLERFFSSQAPLRYHFAGMRLRRWYRAKGF